MIRLSYNLLTTRHTAVQKTLNRAKKKMYWPNMEMDVNNYVHAYKSCAQRVGYGKSKASLDDIFT